MYNRNTPNRVSTYKTIVHSVFGIDFRNGVKAKYTKEKCYLGDYDPCRTYELKTE